MYFSSNDQGAEYVDFRKSFLADTREAVGTLFKMDQNKYDWVILNVPNFKAVARDRVYNPCKITDGYSIDLEKFEQNMKNAREDIRARNKDSR